MDRCIYCDQPIRQESFKTLFIRKDMLCIKCRSLLPVKRISFIHAGYQVETFYKYAGLFKSLLIQYKEANDEALSEVFLYDLLEYISIRYFDYYLVCIPSSKEKRELRGFDHLELMFKDLPLKRLPGLEMKVELSQKGKGRAEREKMIDNYRYLGPEVKKILIVDDVFTSGSSIEGACNTLACHCQQLKALVLAKA